ncbi:HAD domain-containing protein [Paraburkholderia sp. RL17-373-BIF-A]|uniref:hypothetical protein n=1 Tax=Paraburkholderia sp. RL17-373-BIF-A TaxID=3031629 RepID=UPI0038BAF129
MNSILYLGAERLLFPRLLRSSPPRQPARESSSQSILFACLIETVLDRPDLAIVLNSWLVVDYGYCTLRRLLPLELAQKTIGATMRGNRAHRRSYTTQSKIDLLRSDIARRNPQRVTIIDGERMSIPFEYLGRSIAVGSTSTSSLDRFQSRLQQLLDSD